MFPRRNCMLPLRNLYKERVYFRTLQSGRSELTNMAAKSNPDLARERKNPAFDIDKLTYILDGGQFMTDRRRDVEALAMEEDEFTKGPNYQFLSRPDKYSEGVRKAVHYMKKVAELDFQMPADSYWYRNHNMNQQLFAKNVFPNEAAPMWLHIRMFIPSLEQSCSDEQLKKWLPLAKNFQIIGTYAQTEMGHGTHLRGLETIATYDPKTEEFVIHSPTLTSTKWWPGGLGKTSDHVVLMAQLFSSGKNLGIHPFIVQIRDLMTHQPMPGVEVGDIGPKFGYESIDNGFLRFDHYRIPRTHMLAKNSEILKDGTYVTKAKNKRLSYGTMVFIRAMIVLDVAGKGLAQAITIATRYSCVRRQSELKPGGPEPQIIEFQTQQYKLFPLLATSYALMFAGRHMRDMYFQTNYEIQQGNVELLPELHAVSSCLKAFSTYAAMWGIEVCRLSCGGHGYSQASGIPKIYATTTPGCTYEGENTVLYLQTARYLMKAYDNMKAGNQVTGSVSYLNKAKIARSSVGANLRVEDLVDALQYRARRLVEKGGERYNKLRAKMEQYLAWNNSAVDLVSASEAHAHFYVMDTFTRMVGEVDDEPIKHVLTKLCQLFACHGITNNAAVFLENGYMTGEQLDVIKDGMFRLMGEIRPHAVNLVDAFDFSDHMLGSVLGRYDGNVYENLYKWAQDSPLNETQVHSSYEKYIKPFREEMRQKSKL